jgi:alpha-tubulin suppressor-like RCC1 family protein
MKLKKNKNWVIGFIFSNALFIHLSFAQSIFSAGDMHSCKIEQVNFQQKLYCWGNNTKAQLGVPLVLEGYDEYQSKTEVKFPGSLQPTDVAAGSSATCAIAGGKVFCWGQMGNVFGPTPKEIILESGITAKKVFISKYTQGDTACAIASNDYLYCWGGLVGLDIPILMKENQLNPFKVKSAALGRNHGCLLTTYNSSTSSNKVYCWGKNDYYQLGDGTTDSSLFPKEIRFTSNNVPQNLTTVSIAAGAHHTCAIERNGGVWCWGKNDKMQAGFNTFDTLTQPPVEYPLKVFSFNQTINSTTAKGEVAAGESHTCAMAGGKVKCWGDRTSGQVPLADSNLIFQDLDATQVQSISLGTYHTCYEKKLADSTYKRFCVGSNQEGQIFLDPCRADKFNFWKTSLCPSQAGYGPTTRNISSGGPASCSIGNDGSLECWGRKFLNGPSVGSELITNPRTLGTNVTSVSVGGKCHVEGGGDAGDGHVCAVMNSQVKCWGKNSFGQLGIGSTAEQMLPTLVPGLDGATQVALGTEHSCALRNGQVYCWGHNKRYQVKNSSELYFSTPQLIQGISNVKAIVAGRAHTCALTNDSDVWCWGDNTYGQMALPVEYHSTGLALNPTKAIAPTKILNNVKSLSSGARHLCVLENNGTVKCWGDNTLGQTGQPIMIHETPYNSQIDNPIIEPVIVPTPVSGLSMIAKVTNGSDHTCALTTDQKAYCWGDNGHGQLGKTSEVKMSSSPLLIGMTNVSNIFTSANSGASFLVSEGVVYSWGENMWYELALLESEKIYYQPQPIP